MNINKFKESITFMSLKLKSMNPLREEVLEEEITNSMVETFDDIQINKCIIDNKQNCSKENIVLLDNNKNMIYLDIISQLSDGSDIFNLMAPVWFKLEDSQTFEYKKEMKCLFRPFQLRLKNNNNYLRYIKVDDIASLSDLKIIWRHYFNQVKLRGFARKLYSMYIFITHNHKRLDHNTKLSTLIDLKTMNAKLDLILADNSNKYPGRKVIRNFIVWATMRGFNLTYIYSKAHYFAKANKISLLEIKSIYFKVKNYIRDKDFTRYLSSDWAEEIYEFPIIYNKGHERINEEAIPKIINSDENMMINFGAKMLNFIVGMADKMFDFDKKINNNNIVHVNQLDFSQPKNNPEAQVANEDNRIDLSIIKVAEEGTTDFTGDIFATAIQKAIEHDNKLKAAGIEIEDDDYGDYVEYDQDDEETFMPKPRDFEVIVAEIRSSMTAGGSTEEEILKEIEYTKGEYDEYLIKYERNKSNWEGEEEEYEECYDE